MSDAALHRLLRLEADAITASTGLGLASFFEHHNHGDDQAAAATLDRIHADLAAGSRGDTRVSGEALAHAKARRTLMLRPVETEAPA